MTIGALGTSASAARRADEPRPTGSRAEMPKRPPIQAAGLIVKSKTSALPGADVLATAKKALGSKADVRSAKRLSGKISTIAFDTLVSDGKARAAAAAIENRGDVEWAAPNTLRRPFLNPSPVKPNDAKFTQQRHLWDGRSASTSLPKEWKPGGYSSKAPALWKASKGSPDVVVAVLDTGITSHPDLDANIVPGYDFVSDFAVPGQPAGYQTNDGNGRDSNASDPGDWVSANACGYEHPALPSSWHGTHVAGIIAAQSDNAIGVAGVAPRTKVQPIRVLGRCGGLDSDIVAAMLWATGRPVEGVPPNPTPAKILNLSFGSEYFPLGDEWQDEQDAAAEVSESCLTLSPGIEAADVVVAAAGNSGGPAKYAVPAACPGVISVAATGSRGLAATYSNWGDTIDMSAYGGDEAIDGSSYGVLSTLNTGATTPGSPSYGFYEGTSMAAPIVSGGAALLAALGMDRIHLDYALRHSLQKFPSFQSKYSNIRVQGFDYPLELNCVIPVDGRNHNFCGSGIFDLSKVQAPITQPKIKGYFRVGQTLTISPGSWTPAGKGLWYEWYRDDERIAASPEATTYRTHSYDLGKKITVRVKPAYEATYRDFTTTAETPALIQAKSTTSISLPTSISHTKRAYVSVTVKATGYWPTGELTVYDRDKKLLSVHLTSTSQHGTRTIKLPALAKGYHKITVQYGGTKYILPSTSPMKQIKSK